MPIHNWKQVDDGIFHAFHVWWVPAICDVLNDSLLPSDFYALPEQRAGGKEPDVLTLHAEKSPPHGAALLIGEHPEAGSGAIALAHAPPQVAYVEVFETEYYVRMRRSIAIRHVSDDRVVALIEIMSAGNKASQYFLDQFLEKAIGALEQGIHVLIVDLYPPTARDPRGIHGALAEAIVDARTPFDPVKPLTLVSYLAADSAKRAYYQPVAVGECLTPMPLFLDIDHYVSVPLEQTYMTAFEHVPRRWREVLERPAAQ